MENPSSSSASSNKLEKVERDCYNEWMCLQAKRMIELKEALSSNGRDQEDENKLKDLIQKVVGEFGDYAGKRSKHARQYCSNYFAPMWNTGLENALLWLGGCRPSSFIRLIYAMCGSQTEQRMINFLHNNGLSMDLDEPRGGGINVREDSMCDLTAEQLVNINDLHLKTVEEENKLTKQSASLQEDTADMPIAVTAFYKEEIGEADEVVERALDKYEQDMAGLLAEADKLRLTTLTKIVDEILTPVQAADFLLAGKKLHLSMHEWGRVRERRRLEPSG